MKSYEERYAIATKIHDAGMIKVITTPVPEGQKFLPGTFVQIASKLGEGMEHFPKDCAAQVIHTYAHAYCGDNVKSYAVLRRYSDTKWSFIAWYQENQLREITDKELIAQYQKEIDLNRFEGDE